MKYLSVLTVLFFLFSYSPYPPEQLEDTPIDTRLERFIDSCVGKGEHFSCIYSPNTLSLRLTFGPVEDLPRRQGALIWEQPWSQEIVSILAHNYADGQLFYNFTIGSEIVLITPEGETVEYTVEEIDKWRNKGKWKTFSPWSSDGDTIS